VPTVWICASFEFDKANKLRGDFFGQAKMLTPHRVSNHSLREAYPSQEWKSKARAVIRECDVVVVLVGQGTHNALASGRQDGSRHGAWFGESR
jgi:hypothetical protein